MRRNHKTLPVTLLLLTVIPACSLSSGACGSGIEPAPPPEAPETVATEEAATTPPPETEAKGPVTKPDYDGPGPYDCEDAANCTRTCGGGVLNRLWFHAHTDQVPKCKDGCAGKGAGKPICVDGACVATDREGNVNEHCTRKLGNIE